ncbi:hypothetical protein ACHAXT_001402 [Thalassiosira profunda]
MPLYDLWGASDVDIEIAKDIFPGGEWLREKDELFDHPEHGWFESTYRKKRLHFRKNVPSGGLKAIVVWAHGICGQSGFGMKIGERYTDQALRIRQMGEAGIAVYSFDMLGHGFSEGGRFYIPDGKWEINRDDLVAFCKLAAKDHDVPLFVSGDSYGGCLALHAAHYFQTHPDECPVVGACLNCPSIEADLPPLPVQLVLRYALAPFFPKTTPFFMPHPITSERIWQEPEARAYFSNHEEMHGLSRGGEPFCLVTAVGLLASLQEAQKVCHEFDLPFHISHGDCDYGVPLSGSQHLYDNCKTPDEKKLLNIIKGGYHAFFSRPDAADILDHEIRWIEQMIREKGSK